MEDKAHQANDNVNHPAHYGGADNPYEAIKVIEACGLGFCLGNAVKYISRAGKKDPSKKIEDLQKAVWYINHEIKRLQKDMATATNGKTNIVPPCIVPPLYDAGRIILIEGPGGIEIRNKE